MGKSGRSLNVGEEIWMMNDRFLSSYNMYNIAKLEFAALEVSGKNYVSWMIDVKIHLESMRISNDIYEFNNCLTQDKTKRKFDHQKEVILPNARDEWRTLRLKTSRNIVDKKLWMKICWRKITPHFMQQTLP
uniref:Uncharacterized protein n=1 Tax=Lactuca sativa TaxID=4236 RepID=A0A9R1VBY3_LACSA|nr:hypothetical protein LSAT_V11C500263290 [Lactuca sativa]